MRKYVFSIYPLFKSRVRVMSALKLLPGYSIKLVGWMISNLDCVWGNVGVGSEKALMLFSTMSQN